MLIIVPSSEGKRAPESGAPIESGALSFPELAPLRERALDALIAASTRPGALGRLGLGASLEGELARNIALRSAAAAPALEVYDGVLHRALDAGSFGAAARRRAGRSLVIASALFGLLRPSDRIAPYRLPIAIRLEGIGRLDSHWRDGVGALLGSIADGPVLDLRAASYRALGPSDPERTVMLRLTDGVAGGNVALKRARGFAARRLLEAPTEPTSIEGLAELLATDWSVELTAPIKRGATWTLSLAPRA